MKYLLKQFPRMNLILPDVSDGTFGTEDYTGGGVSFTSSPLLNGGFTSPPSSTIDHPSADTNSSGTDIGDILSSIGSTVVGAITVSRIPAQQLAKTGYGQSPQQTQLQTRQLQLQQQQQSLIIYGIIAAVVIVLIMAFIK